jgi:protein SHQ1
VYLGLVDIAFGYCYDYRTTDGEPTVESAWTICKLSSTLSCFEQFESVEEVCIASLRRSLAYPLYRNFKLASKVWNDVSLLFQTGKRGLLRMLLQSKMIVERNEQTSIFSRLYLEDYCVWIQSEAAKDVFSRMGEEMLAMKLDKQLVGWRLQELENEVTHG